jgi:cytochrome c553
MKAVVALLSDEDINAASSYLVAQPLPANSKPAASAPPLAAGQAAVNCGSAARP